MATAEMVSLARAGFTYEESSDILDAAIERGVSPQQLIHDAVMNDLYR